MAKQVEFNFEAPITAKLFSHKKLAEAKIEYLSKNLKSLEWGEVTWLARIEEFYRDKEYITEKQINVLHALVSKYQSLSI